MKPKSAHAKGKKFEKEIAKKLGKFFEYTYSRADSGSGKFQKEDITVPDNVPLHIECKHHAKLNINTWWNQTIDGCPDSKYPVLIYKTNYQPAKVYMKLADSIGFAGNSKQKIWMNNIMITMLFDDFLKLIEIRQDTF